MCVIGTLGAKTAHPIAMSNAGELILLFPSSSIDFLYNL